MILRLGERVFWGAPEIIYLEGIITSLDAKNQTATVHIDRATPHSAHLINTDVPFAADGLKPLQGNPPPGTTSEHSTEQQSLPPMDDDEKIRRAAAAAVHQQYGYQMSEEQESILVGQVAQAIHNDSGLRKQIIASMNSILHREQKQ